MTQCDSDNELDDPEAEDEDDLLEWQEGKGYGEDEGERDEYLEEK